MISRKGPIVALTVRPNWVSSALLAVLVALSLLVPGYAVASSVVTPASSASSDTHAAITAPPTAIAQRGRAPEPPKRARVLKVLDGDTLVLQGEERVRVLYINTPEKKEELGPEAGEFTRDLLLMKEVELVYSARSQRDSYGRLLAEVRFDDGQDLATSILRAGLAHIFLIAPDAAPEHLNSLLEAQADARANHRNIWATDRYSGALHITSFHANARGDDRYNLSGEYLRIANATTEPVNVAGYTLSCEHGKVLTLPDFIVPAGYSFKIVSGEGDTNDDPTLGGLKIYWGVSRPIWNNERDSATLRDDTGRVIDRVVHAPKRR